MELTTYLFGLFLVLVQSTFLHAQLPFGLKEKVRVTDTQRDLNQPSLYCHRYTESKHLSETEWAAYAETEKCEQSGSHCFMSWRNDSGEAEIVKAGCWLRDVNCLDSNECRAPNNTANKGVYYCCCSGDLCNEKFYLDPAIDDRDEFEEEENPPYNQWLIILYIILPLSFVCFVILMAFYLYRRRKQALDDLDSVSVDTPATAGTRCTSEFSPTSIDTPSPQLIEVKARGRFGKVWRAQWGDRLVAVKTFNQSEKRSWQNEQEIFVTPLMNSHDNILKYLAASNRGEGINSELWLVTEFHDWGSLADYLKLHTVTLNEALQIMKSMASGMSFLHEDVQRENNDYKPAIAHRDFKSKNVLLDQNLNAVIADFGLARKFTPGESTGECHSQVGTVRYMAPEVLQGAITFQKDAFLRIDMYAFGLVMWEILSRCTETGEPFDECRLPFEKELGTHPEMSVVQEYVSEQKMRPEILQGWKKDKLINTVCDTMRECWDNDSEARLSAGCVQLRIDGLQRHRSMSSSLINNVIHDARNHDDAMNQINLQMNGQSGLNTTSFIDDTQNQDSQKQKVLTGSYVVLHDDDHDSGTFANEDTLSHDGVMEQLIVSETGTDDSGVPLVRVVSGDEDSATSLLTDDQETDL